MDRDQRVHALELRAGRKHDRAATPRRAPPARAARDHRPQEPGPTCPSPHARILAGHHRAREIPPMLAALARRLAAGLAVVAGVATLTFFLLRLAPGDPVERLLGPAATAEQLAAQRQALGLDQSLPAQYAAWLARMARGEWGRSIASGRPVRAVLAEAWPATAALIGLSLLLSYLVGIGGTARFVRGAMLDARAAPFVTTALAKGLAAPRVWLHHVLRNALVPVVTLLGLSLPALFSGAVFVEAVFAWPGVGRILVEAVQARDYPVVMAATTVSAFLVVVGNLLADLLLAWVDPRIHYRSRET